MFLYFFYRKCKEISSSLDHQQMLQMGWDIIILRLFCLLISTSEQNCYYIQKLLQSNQVKHTLEDYINELII